MFLTNTPTNIITGDLNAHSNVWHSSLNDHRDQSYFATLARLGSQYIKDDFRLVQYRRTCVKYNKVDWAALAQNIGTALNNTQPTTNSQIGNKILTTSILTADKHHRPKNKID